MGFIHHTLVLIPSKLTYKNTTIRPTLLPKLPHNSDQPTDKNNRPKLMTTAATIQHSFLLLLLLLPFLAAHDYREALSKSILFFEGQRSGKLPPEQRQAWRKDSGIRDGFDSGVDLSGGYYDAGDNVKFGFPMAFTVTMLSWSVVEFGSNMPSDEIRNAAVAIRWGTDYLLKTISQPNRIFVQVIKVLMT